MVHSKEEHDHSTVSEIYEFIEEFQDPREEWYFRLTSLLNCKDQFPEDSDIVIKSCMLLNLLMSLCVCYKNE